MDESLLKYFENIHVETLSLMLTVVSQALRSHHVWTVSMWVINGAAGSRAISTGGVWRVGRERKRRRGEERRGNCKEQTES